MTASKRDRLDALLVAVADPTRRSIFEAIVANPGITTSELAERATSVTRWAVMKHLEVLRGAGLIQTMTTGRLRRHYAERSSLRTLRAWLDDVSG